MPSTTIASATFSSRRAADQAIQRLVASGFSRNSMDLHPHGDDEGCDLEIHTRRDNLQRVERLLNMSPTRYAMSQAGSGAMHTATAHPLVLLGAGILAGFALYQLFPREESTQQQALHGGGRGSARHRHRRHS